MATGKYGDVFDVLGDRSTVLREWTRLRRVVVNDPVLRDLSYSEFVLPPVLTFRQRPCHVLLLAAIVHAAWIYNGASLASYLHVHCTLKKKKAKRKARMLLYLMGTALGRHWATGDSMSSTISINKLVEGWLCCNADVAEVIRADVAPS